MFNLIDRLTNYCLSRDIISEDNIEWFKYGLEKRLSTLIVAIPFFILAILLSNFYAATSFYITFYLLRSRINGYHSKKLWTCLFLSLVLEACFIGIFYIFLDIIAIYIIAAVSALLIFQLSPFNHPNMHLTQEELIACRKSARIRVCYIVIGIIISALLGIPEFAKGSSLGIAMAAFLLCLAYIINGGITNEKRE